MLKLLVMFFLGLILIAAGIEQNLGSIIGALIDPGNMIDNSNQGSVTSVTGTGTGGTN